MVAGHGMGQNFMWFVINYLLLDQHKSLDNNEIFNFTFITLLHDFSCGYLGKQKQVNFSLKLTRFKENVDVFEMEECAADQIWANFLQNIKNDICKSCSHLSICLQETKVNICAMQ